jgi:DNA repair exonuclease SbcCD ATPase subunit
MHKYSSLCQ